jgi:hypothetical protein
MRRETDLDPPTEPVQTVEHLLTELKWGDPLERILPVQCVRDRLRMRGARSRVS